MMKDGDTINCERCGAEVTVNVKKRYRMHPLAKYVCQQCGNTAVWQVVPELIIRQGEE